MLKTHVDPQKQPLGIGWMQRLCRLLDYAQAVCEMLILALIRLNLCFMKPVNTSVGYFSCTKFIGGNYRLSISQKLELCHVSGLAKGHVLVYKGLQRQNELGFSCHQGSCQFSKTQALVPTELVSCDKRGTHASGLRS